MFSMKKLGVLCMAALMAFGAGAAVTANYRVVPLPQKIQTSNAAGFALNARTVISYPKDQKELANEASFLQEYLKKMTGLKLAVKAGATGDNCIALSIDPAIGNAEGYRLVVDRSARAKPTSGAQVCSAGISVADMREWLDQAWASGIVQRGWIAA